MFHAIGLQFDSSFLTFLYVSLVVLLILAGLTVSAASKKRRLERLRAGSGETPLSYSGNERRTKIDARSFVYALRNPDWEARSAAVLALGVYGDESAVEPLAQVLLRDRNEVVRENAAQSLNRIDCVRAVEPLTRVIRDYLKGNDKSTKLVMTCAKLLGETGDPEAISCLQELHERLEKDGFEQESKKVSKAVSKVRISAKAVGKKCCVCNLTLNRGDEAVRCPFCLNVAHKDHMREWLHVRGSCPVCQRHVSESELQSV
jgi:hypothetical protein